MCFNYMVPDENWGFVDIDKATLERVDETLSGLVRTGNRRRAMETNELARNGDLLVDDDLNKH